MKKHPTVKHSKHTSKQPKRVEHPVQLKVVRKVLGKAPEEVGFLLADGRRLNSLYDLIHALQDMPDDVFRHHVNDERNDFSNWVNDVFEEPELANELRNINSKLDAELVLLRKMVKSLEHKK
ncbi:MAG: DUF5752 family protein [Candidatus Woesearchaeota archaeon]